VARPDDELRRVCAHLLVFREPELHLRNAVAAAALADEVDLALGARIPELALDLLDALVHAPEERLVLR
jgi:hypothetical protein